MTDDDHVDLDRIDMTVQELLTEMKDISEVIVDLAYASLMYNSRELALRVNELEDEMEELKYAMRVKTLMAARMPNSSRESFRLHPPRTASRTRPERSWNFSMWLRRRGPSLPI